MTIKKFRPYVELMQFTVITDHASLQWLMNLKDLSGRLARWSLQLQGYNFDLQHRKGKENIVADMLSRLPTVEELDLEPALDLETDEFECEVYKELRQNIKANQEKLPDLRIVEHLIFKRGHVEYNAELHEFQWKLWVPESLTHKLIRKAHDDVTSAHGRISKNINRLKEKYYWPNIHSDNGAQFTSKTFKEIVDTYKINHLQTAPYSPQSNASERVNQSVLAAIRAYLESDHREWDLYLTEIECALRSSVHTATGVTPFFALFGYKICIRTAPTIGWREN